MHDACHSSPPGRAQKSLEECRADEVFELQAAVPVRSADTVETLSARILVEEHRLYPQAIRLVLAGGWLVQGRRFMPAHAQ